MKPHWHERFYALAQLAATWSKDPEVQVGCVIVSPDRRRFSFGYNGFPTGVADDDRLTSPQRLALMVHAELNAILNSAERLKGWKLYTTRQPCMECAKAIIQAGISEVYAPPLMKTSSKWCNAQDAVMMLLEAGVKFAQIVEDEK